MEGKLTKHVTGLSRKISHTVKEIGMTTFWLLWFIKDICKTCFAVNMLTRSPVTVQSLLNLRSHIRKQYRCKMSHNDPVTLQVVHPTVRDFIRRWNRLQGFLILSVIWCFHHTTDGIIHSYMHWAKPPCPSTTV